MKFHARVFNNCLAPIRFQVMKSFLLAACANGIVKIYGLPDCLLWRKGSRSDCFKLTYVRTLWLVAREQWPRFSDKVFFNEHHPCPERSAEPLVQARSEIVTIEVGYLIVYVCE